MITPAKMPDLKSAKEGLANSVAHWERLLNLLIERDSVGLLEEKWGTFTCDLCSRFIKDDCCQCPVRHHSGNKACYDTPYAKAALALHDFIHSHDEQTFGERVVAVEKEVAFLKDVQAEWEEKEEEVVRPEYYLCSASIEEQAGTDRLQAHWMRVRLVFSMKGEEGHLYKDVAFYTDTLKKVTDLEEAQL